MMSLLLSFLYVGALSFGGGYAVLALIEQQIVEKGGYITASEFADIVSISQTTPGPIAINAATFVGMKTYGVAGALLCTLSCILPTVILSLIIAVIYKKYREKGIITLSLRAIRPATVGFIAAAALSLIVTSFSYESQAMLGGISIPAAVIFAICIFLLMKVKLSPVIVMLVSGAAGVIIYGILGLFH